MHLNRRLLREIRLAGPWPAIAIGLGLLGGAATLLQALYLSKIIAAVFLENASPKQVERDLLALLLVVALRAMAIGSREAAASNVAVRVKTELRERLLAHLFALGPIYVSGERAGELASTVHEGIEALDGYFSQYLPNLVLAALIPTAILAFTLPMDPLSGIVLLLTAPLIPLFMILIGKRAEALTHRQWETLSALGAHFLDVLQGLSTLKLLGRSQKEVERLARTSDRFRVTTMGVLRVAFLSSLALEMISTISTAVVAVEVGLRLLYGTLAFQQALFILILAPEFYLPLRNLGAGFHAGVSGLAAAARIFEILGMPPQPGDGGTKGQDTPPNGSHPPSSQVQLSLSPPHIRFEDVRLVIDGRAILDGVSFEVPPGERVALVGPSGAGKSSIARLLLGFMRPDGGRILIDGRPVEEIGFEEWRRRVAWVPQDPYLFHATVAENLRLARPGATEEELVQAAKRASAHGFILGLSAGYDTVIGERGERLSGGQAQRLALARALLKDAGLLILDEPTSHLDSGTESSLLDALERASIGRTVISIVHRLEAARRADRVLVLDRGKLVAVGGHQDLIRDWGLYKRLVEVDGGCCPEDSTVVPDATALAPGGHGEVSLLPIPIPGGVQRPQASQHEPATKLNCASPVRKGDLHTVGRLLRLAAPYGGRMALSVLLGSATVAAGVGLTATAAFLIALAALHPSVAELSVPIVGVRFFGLSRGLLRYLERYFSHDVTFRLLTRLKVWFFQAVEAAPPAWLMDQRPGDLLNRVVSDMDALQHLFVRALAPPLVALVVSIALLLLLAGFGPSLSLALFPFLLASGVGLPLIAARMGRGSSMEAAQLRAELTIHLVDGVRGMADLLAFGQEARFLGQVRAMNRRWASAQRRSAMLSGLHAGAATLLAGMGMWTVLAVAIPPVWGGLMAGMYLPVVVMATLAGFEAVAPLPAAFQQLAASMEAAGRLFEVVDVRQPGPRAERLSGQVPRALHVASTSRRIPPDLVVEGLSFRYIPSGPLALDGVSFRLDGGDSLAIVGPSGAGKSTLVNLLLRLWDYEEGLILLGGRDLRSYERHELTRLMAVVPQRVHMFNGTLRENILMARPEADEGQLRRAVEMAGLEALVRRLPNGYDTKVGDLGMRLSGGERQRVAIARAFIKDSPVLILDEPTSSLDGVTEREVLKALRGLMEGRTTLLITHSPTLLSTVDRVLELEQGRVREHPLIPGPLRLASRPQ